jgi:hypothetical protein
MGEFIDGLMWGLIYTVLIIIGIVLVVSAFMPI